jgi:hypothetical protein
MTRLPLCRRAFYRRRRGALAGFGAELFQMLDLVQRRATIVSIGSATEPAYVARPRASNEDGHTRARLVHLASRACFRRRLTTVLKKPQMNPVSGRILADHLRSHNVRLVDMSRCNLDHWN